MTSTQSAGNDRGQNGLVGERPERCFTDSLSRRSSSMSTRRKRLTLVGVLFAGLIGLFEMTARTLTLSAGPQGTAAAQPKAEPPRTGQDKREADRNEIQAQTERFL